MLETKVLPAPLHKIEAPLAVAPDKNDSSLLSLARGMIKLAPHIMPAYLETRKTKNKGWEVTAFCEEVERRMNGKEIYGIDEFRDVVKDLENLPQPANKLFVMNHPDFLAGAEQPIWFASIIAEVGRITNKDPYLFLSRRWAPTPAVRNTQILNPGRAYYGWGRKNTAEIFERTKKALRDRSGVNSFFIFPEGTNVNNDVMQKGYPNGTVTLISTAVEENIPLYIIPTVLIQELVSRGEASDTDRLTVKTAAPVHASSLLPRGYTGSDNEKQAIVDNLLTRIAWKIKEEKRGYYWQSVDTRQFKSKHLQLTRAEKVVFQSE